MDFNKLDSCPICHGDLVFSKLTCENCKTEFPINVPVESHKLASLFLNLTAEQMDFLTLFLQSRGNLKTVCEKQNKTYPTIKRRLDDLLRALNLLEDDTEPDVDLRSFGEVDYHSKKPSEIIRRKLYEAGGKVIIKLLTGKDCLVTATEDGKSITSDKLNNYTLKFDYTVFDMIVDFLKEKGGSAPKGNSYGEEDKVGQGKCTEGTIVYHIAVNYSKKAEGTSVNDPVFVLAAILDWAGIAKNCRGYVQLCDEYMATEEDKMTKLEKDFQTELETNALETKKVCRNYNPTRYIQMLKELGGVATAKRLIAKAMETGVVPDGYTALYIEGKLHLSMEASVCKEKFRCLFTEEEVQYCKKILNR